MCTGVEIALVAMAVTAVGTGVSIYQAQETADAQASWAEYNASVQNTQLKEQRDLAAIQAQEQENARMRKHRQMQAANEAFIAGSGVGQNLSYFDGAEAYAEKVLTEDLSALRLNLSVAENRFDTQISVNRAQADFTSAMGDMQVGQAIMRAPFDIANAGIRAYGAWRMPASSSTRG